MIPNPHVLIDLETRSACDLPKEGGRRYSVHPSTEILTVAWTFDNHDHLWVPGIGEAYRQNQNFCGMVDTHIAPETVVHLGSKLPQELKELTRYPWVAHNAWGFDSLVWGSLFPEHQPVEWIDTEPLARIMGLPGQLDKIGKELRHKGKHQEGKSRLKKFMGGGCTPGIGDLVVIGAYCLDDTAGLLRVLVEHLQKFQLTDFEKNCLSVTRYMNETGVKVDLPFAIATQNLCNLATESAIRECNRITEGLVKNLKDLRNRKLIFGWIAKQGVSIGSSLKKDVIEQLIRESEVNEEENEEEMEDGEDNLIIPPLVIEFLRTRFMALRITKGKTDAALMRSFRGRLHDFQVHYGAHTGRTAGRGFQILNLPIPKDTIPVWKVVNSYTVGSGFDSNTITEILGGKSNLDDAASAMLRGILIPEDNEVFVDADYSQVELRGLALAAKEQKLLQMFQDNISPYFELASRITGRPITDKKDPMYKVGKFTTLGCGYQMGKKKCAVYMAVSGVDLASVNLTPNDCIQAFRNAYPTIAGECNGDLIEETGDPIRRGGLWSDMQKASFKAIESGISRCSLFTFRLRDGDLFMYLPSGRPLIYRKARIEMVVPPWEVGKADPRKVQAVVYRSPRFGGIDQQIRGGGMLVENAIQALCRDVLYHAKYRLLKEGIKLRFSVYDSCAASVKNEEEARLHTKILSEPPEWLPNFPLMAEGEMLPRYAKAGPSDWPKFNYLLGKEVL